MRPLNGQIITADINPFARRALRALAEREASKAINNNTQKETVMEMKTIKGTTTYTVEVEIEWEVRVPMFVDPQSVEDAMADVNSLESFEDEVGEYIVNDCEQEDIESLGDEDVEAIVTIHQRIDSVNDAYTEITDEGEEGE